MCVIQIWWSPSLYDDDLYRYRYFVHFFSVQILSTYYSLWMRFFLFIYLYEYTKHYPSPYFVTSSYRKLIWKKIILLIEKKFIIFNSQWWTKTMDKSEESLNCVCVCVFFFVFPFLSRYLSLFYFILFHITWPPHSNLKWSLPKFFFFWFGQMPNI